MEWDNRGGSEVAIGGETKNKAAELQHCCYPFQLVLLYFYELLLKRVWEQFEERETKPGAGTNLPKTLWLQL